MPDVLIESGGAQRSNEIATEQECAHRNSVGPEIGTVQ